MYFVSSQIIRSLTGYLASQGLNKEHLLNNITQGGQQLNNSRYKYPLADYEQLMAIGAKLGITWAYCFSKRLFIKRITTCFKAAYLS